ncbi:hypothetical protein JQ600_35555 [Bradyrhizobium sp. AUGA SZCCT0176]|uniref:hypothetical protein n=1 Tax=Bradyrhizobium sp. AUGA SZCCT0176 TaxID=2807664 RepID=UPI001BA98E3F|nr:hypothetical protein [Bradyrhizobium sp. AUGA SZCCT0176]MBR1230214.1 hypothetical protein [Bradyrhizobium sp. AUGA SZCCT0176]
MNLSKNVQIDQVLGYFAAGTTKRTSTILDMAGYDGVLFVAGLGTLIEAGTVDVFVEQNTINSTSGMARLAGQSAHTVTAANALLTSSAIVVDIENVTEQYVQCNITPATQNAVVLGIVAIRYSGRVKPTLNSALLKSTLLAGPAEA